MKTLLSALALAVLASSSTTLASHAVDDFNSTDFSYADAAYVGAVISKLEHEGIQTSNLFVDCLVVDSELEASCIVSTDSSTGQEIEEHDLKCVMTNDDIDCQYLDIGLTSEAGSRYFEPELSFKL